MTEDTTRSGQHLVPRATVSFEEFAQFADGAGWRLDRRSVRAARYSDSPEFRWRVDAGTLVTLVESATLRRSYVVLSGEGREKAAALVRDAFPCYDLDEIIGLLTASRADEEALVESLYLLAATRTPDYRAEVYDVVRDAMNHDHDYWRVRTVALTAAFYLEWRQFRPLVEQLSESTKASKSTRALATNLHGLSSWDRG